jgi:glycosyltransferase involved in cell wall biosynthesis
MRDGSGKTCEKCLGGNVLHCVKNKCIKGSTLMSILSAYEAEYIRRRKWYDDVDLYICPSDFYRDKLTEGAFTKSPIVTMRNPLPLDTVFETSGRNEGYILYFGRLSPEKGVKTLIEAAKLCGCRLVILGTGPQEEELKELAAGSANIEFKGFQTGEALKNYVRNSHCVVLPSEWYENGPYSAMEAMAMGKPLIVSNNGGLPELVEHGKNGYVYGYNPQQLADAIARMQNLSEAAYRDMCNASLEKAKNLFNAVFYVENLEKRYQEIKETRNV